MKPADRWFEELFLVFKITQFLCLQVNHVFVDGAHHAVVEACGTVQEATLQHIEREEHPQGPQRHAVQDLLQRLATQDGVAPPELAPRDLLASLRQQPLRLHVRIAVVSVEPPGDAIIEGIVQETFAVQVHLLAFTMVLLIDVTLDGDVGAAQ